MALRIGVCSSTNGSLDRVRKALAPEAGVELIELDDGAGMDGTGGSCDFILQEAFEKPGQKPGSTEFAKIVERTPNGILIVDAAGTILFANPVANGFLAREEGPVVGSTFSIPSFGGDVTELEICRKGREPRVLEMRMSDLEWDGNTAYLIVMRDVTEHKKFESALRDSEQRHRTMFETMPQGVTYRNASDRIIAANPAAERILGATLDELRGRTSMDPRWRAIHEDGSHFRGEDFPSAAALKTGQPVNNVVMGIFNPAADGYRWLKIDAVPLFRPGDSRPYQVYATFDDITERMQTEQALTREMGINAAAREISLAAIGSMSIQAISALVLEKIKGLTGSESGIVSYFDPRSGHAVAPQGAFDSCPLASGAADMSFENPKGLWRWVIDHQQSVSTNAPKSDNRFGGLPDGHAPIDSLAIVPAVLDGKLVGLLAAANSKKGYCRKDVAVMERFASLYALAVDRRLAIENLERNAKNLRVILDSISAGVLIVNREDLLVSHSNPAAERLIGAPRERIIGKPYQTFIDISEERDGIIRPESFGADNAECKLKADQGRNIPIFHTVAPITLDGQDCLIVTFFDISENKRLESQLLQAQKMEAVGRLAGGVAHDFNNILTGIIGTADLILMDFQGDPEVREDIEDIRKFGERAAALTRQLLAFSRKQVLDPKILNLNDVVVNIEKMLRRLIGEDIDMKLNLQPDLGEAEVDPGQMEQVVMNLAVNARDAMPNGGRLTIETSNVEMDEESDRDGALIPGGSYVMLSIGDTGTGMSEEVQARLFEPFFTTKEQGKGTGLGLATVYGIVRQSGGHIALASRPGDGATFRIHFPRILRAEDPDEAPGGLADLEDLPIGTETILLVEDEPLVRKMTRRILEKNGYYVLDADSGEAAITLCEEHNGPIDLMISDVVMPGMSGPELAQQVRGRRPHMKKIFMTGYAEHSALSQADLASSEAFLQKPFSPDQLMRKVGELITFPGGDA